MVLYWIIIRNMATGVSAAQVYVVQREGVNPQGERTVAALKTTQVKTDSGVILTKHEYVEVEANGRNQPATVNIQRLQTAGYQTDQIPTQIQRASSDDDDVPMCLVLCALFMAALSFGSLICGVPAFILAWAAYFTCIDDPEGSRSKAVLSICCSIFGIIVLVNIIVLSVVLSQD